MTQGKYVIRYWAFPTDEPFRMQSHKVLSFYSKSNAIDDKLPLNILMIS